MNGKNHLDHHKILDESHATAKSDTCTEASNSVEPCLVSMHTMSTTTSLNKYRSCTGWCSGHIYQRHPFVGYTAWWSEAASRLFGSGPSCTIGSPLPLDWHPLHFRKHIHFGCHSIPLQLAHHWHQFSDHILLSSYQAFLRFNGALAQLIAADDSSCLDVVVVNITKQTEWSEEVNFPWRHDTICTSWLVGPRWTTGTQDTIIRDPSFQTFMLLFLLAVICVIIANVFKAVDVVTAIVYYKLSWSYQLPRIEFR